MPIDVTSIINNILVEAAKTSDRDNSHFHPSEWDKCHRKIAYQYYEATNVLQVESSHADIDPQTQRIFGNGHSMHDRWRSYLELTGALMGRWECANWAAHERPVIFGLTSKIGVLKPNRCDCGSNRFIYKEVGLYDEETWFGGHVDAVIDTSLVGNTDAASRYIIVDFKSIKPFGFPDRSGGVKFPGFKELIQPLPEHYTQMQIYLFLSGLQYGKFIYECKGTQSVKEFLVIRDDNFLQIKREEAKNLKFLVTHENSTGKKVLPERAYSDKNHIQCKKCKYKNICWK